MYVIDNGVTVFCFDVFSEFGFTLQGNIIFLSVTLPKSTLEMLKLSSYFMGALPPPPFNKFCMGGNCHPHFPHSAQLNHSLICNLLSFIAYVRYLYKLCTYSIRLLKVNTSSEVIYNLVGNIDRLPLKSGESFI